MLALLEQRSLTSPVVHYNNQEQDKSAFSYINYFYI